MIQRDAATGGYASDGPDEEGKPGQWHCCNGLPADERLVSLAFFVSRSFSCFA